MLVCPRCGTSNLHNCCSLSVHLAQYCTGPTFLSNTLTTGTSTSHSHDGRHPLSMATTSHQQATHFNIPEVNIALPTINTLNAMPSISHLSSTQTDLAQSNLHYTDFDDADYSQDNDNHVFFCPWRWRHTYQEMFFLEEQLLTSTGCCFSGSLFERDFTAPRKWSQHVWSSDTISLWSCASSKRQLQDVTCHVPGSTSLIPMPILQVRFFEAHAQCCTFRWVCSYSSHLWHKRNKFIVS